MREMVRAHVVLPKDLVEAIDRVVGARRRSEYVERAVAERLRRDRQAKVLREIAESGGLLNAEDYPHWATPEKTSEWVRTIRREADLRTEQKVSRLYDRDTSPS